MNAFLIRDAAMEPEFKAYLYFLFNWLVRSPDG